MRGSHAAHFTSRNPPRPGLLHYRIARSHILELVERRNA